MIAKKIFNNNSVLSIDANGREIILLGGGVGFGIHKNDEIDKKKIEKIFRLDKKTNLTFQTIVQEMPMQYILLSDKVIRFIKDNTKKKIHDYIYVTLTDHICTTIERAKNNIIFDDALLMNVKNLYREEYEIAVKAVEMIREAVDVEIHDSEADFIALHIINAELDNNMEEIYEITSILDEISNYVIGKFGIFKEGLYYDRFILHCRYLLQRTGEFPKKDSLFKYLIKNDRNSYEEEWNCVEDVAHIIENRKHYCLDENEKFYLFIHLVRLNRK